MRYIRYSSHFKKSWWNPLEITQTNHLLEDPIENQLNHFLDVVRNKVTPLVTLEDGYRNLLIAEALLESNQSTTTIQINDPQP